MEHEQLEKRLKGIEEKVDRVYVSTERTRKYFLYTLIVTIATVIVPLVALVFVIPMLLSSVASYAGI